MTQFTFSNDPVDLLAYEEGYRDHVYLCPTGYPTVGFGRRVTVCDYETGEPIEFPIKRSEEARRLELKANSLHDWLAASYPWYLRLSPQRQAVLISLAYQVGKEGFRKFKDMIIALSRGDFLSAGNEYLDSVAARTQTSKRFARGARILIDNITVNDAVSRSQGGK